MAEPPLRFETGVTLAGGGALAREDLAAALALAPALVGADGGADAALELGFAPDAVIGDMDSVADPQAHAARGARVIALAEQDSTDLEKCLYSTSAPFYLGVGFLGRRFDHSLAALHALLVHETPIVLLSAQDVAFIAPCDWRMRAPAGARMSLLPLREVRALSSAGLEWPLEGAPFALGGRIGASNRASGGDVRARFDRRGMLAVVERNLLGCALQSLGIDGIGEALTASAEAQGGN